MSFSVSFAIAFEDKTAGPRTYSDHGLVFTVFAVRRRSGHRDLGLRASARRGPPPHSQARWKRGTPCRSGFARGLGDAPRGEESRARQGAVEAGPVLTVRQRLLDAV